MPKLTIPLSNLSFPRKIKKIPAIINYIIQVIPAILEHFEYNNFINSYFGKIIDNVLFMGITP